MDEVELNSIRAARLQELQKNANKNNQSQTDQNLNATLDQVLEPKARARLSRVALVRSDRAKAVENYIIRLIKSGQIHRKFNENDIVEILNSISKDEQKKNETKIVFSRKQINSDDEDDYF